jgi:Predicted transcriptional regulators
MRTWLKKIREYAKLTQNDVAERAGISGNYYCMIELGERGNPLNVATAKKIASALGFEWTRFYEHDDAPGVGDTEQPA